MRFFLKRRLFGAFCILGVVAGAGLIFYACDDFGLEADFFRGTVQGVIRISEVVPDTTDEIRVALTKRFPPTDIASLLFSGALPLNRDTSVTSQTIKYDLQVPLGDYEAAFAIWKAKDQSWNPADIVGLYGDFQFYQPIALSLTDDQPLADSINVDIDFTRVKRTSRIEGRITYIGAWPTNTAAVAIFVYDFIPDLGNLNDLIQVSSFEILPTNVDTWDYRVGIGPGLYKYIVVFWLAQGAPITDFHTIGFYRDPANPDQPGQVLVTDEQSATGVDITADFANIGNSETND